MADQRGPLGLRIPPQHPNAAQLPYGRPKDAERWIDALPVAHIGETSRQVYTALVELNRSELPLAHRFRILELFAEPVSYVTRALERYFVDQPLPLSPRNAKIAELAQALQNEMAVGYKIIVEASLSSFTQRVDSKLLLQSVFRAMGFLGAALVKAYQTYSSPPEHLWEEIHHLFLFAEHNELHLAPVKSGRRHSNIEESYKRILLLALANPYRLPQRDVARVYRALEVWANYAQLLPVTDPQHPPGLFSVDLSSDGPPIYYSAEDLGNENMRVLDTSDLIRLIRGHNGDTPGLDGLDLDVGHLDDDFGLPPATLRKLILSWGAVPKRSFSRTGKDVEVLVTLGLSATHYFIDTEQRALYEQAQADEEPDDEAHSRFTKRSRFNASARGQIQDEDVWALADNPTLEIQSVVDFPTFRSEPAPAPAASQPRASSQVYRHYTCHLINESAGGCRLLWKTDVATKTVVGMLVGIRRNADDDAGNWRIGVIRWMKNNGGGDLVLGVELLAPAAEAIGVRKIINDRQAGDNMRSLLLPELRTVNLPETLVTPALYRIGDELCIDVENRRSRVRLTKVVESTGSFAQYQFSFLGSLGEDDPIRDDVAEMSREFSSIWSSI